MARLKQMHRSARRSLRRTLELVILVLGLVAGLAIVGACTTSGFSSFDNTLSFDLPNVLGVITAVLLVGTVFLFVTMSRDLRLLRDRYETEEPAAPPDRPRPAPRSTDAEI
jgi:hypothetical protein